MQNLVSSFAWNIVQNSINWPRPPKTKTFELTSVKCSQIMVQLWKIVNKTLTILLKFMWNVLGHLSETCISRVFFGIPFMLILGDELLLCNYLSRDIHSTQNTPINVIRRIKFHSSEHLIINMLLSMNLFIVINQPKTLSSQIAYKLPR